MGVVVPHGLIPELASRQATLHDARLALEVRHERKPLVGLERVPDEGVEHGGGVLPGFEEELREVDDDGREEPLGGEHGLGELRLERGIRRILAVAVHHRPHVSEVLAARFLIFFRPRVLQVVECIREFERELLGRAFVLLEQARHRCSLSSPVTLCSLLPFLCFLRSPRNRRGDTGGWLGSTFAVRRRRRRDESRWDGLGACVSLRVPLASDEASVLAGGAFPGREKRV